MRKQIIIFLFILMILAGCSNTPEIVNLQSTIDVAVESAVNTAVAPYESMVSVEMLEQSQNEQNQRIQQYIIDEIDLALEDLKKSQKSDSVIENTSDQTTIIESNGVYSTATPSVFSYDNTNCINRFAYVSDLTVADGMSITPGTVFDKSWYITNTGTCTWTSGYNVVYMSGDNIGTAKSFSLLQPGYYIKPGESTIVTATMTAPNSVGSSYASYWAIESDTGEKFGSGESKNVYLNVSFRVDNTFNVAQNFGSLTCYDDYGAVTCGNRDSSRGIVYYDPSPLLETYTSQGVPGIMVQPADGENTSVRFEFGPLRFPRKSWFYTNFCCRPESPSCDVQVRLYVRDRGYSERLITEATKYNDGYLGEWKFQLDDEKIYDQDYYYILEVQANGGASADDLIIFLNTRIY